MLHRLRTLLEMIRFSHTLFALPFALLSAALAWRSKGQFSWLELAGILVCMVFARSAAMLTCHNLAYHGWVPRDRAWQLDLPPEVGDFNGVQLVPFQCTIAPPKPTAHTSSLAAAQTDVSACACGSGCSSVHVPQPTSNDGGGKEALHDTPSSTMVVSMSVTGATYGPASGALPGPLPEPEPDRTEPASAPVASDAAGADCGAADLQPTSDRM